MIVALVESEEHGRGSRRDGKVGRRDRKAGAVGVAGPEGNIIQTGLLETECLIGAKQMTFVMIPGEENILYLKRNTCRIRNAHGQSAVESQRTVIDRVTAWDRCAGGNQ